MTTTAARVTLIVVASVGSVVLLVTGGFWAFSALARDTETITTVYDESDVRLVDIESANGSITVVGGNRDDIVVTATLTHSFRRTNLQTDEQGDRLVIRDRCGGPLFASFCRADYTVQVPTGIAAVLQSRNGSILVTSLEGDLDASSANGRVAATQVTGDVRLRSSNGRVEGTGLSSDRADASSSNGRVSLAFAEAPRAVEATTSNGRVEIVLPETAEAYRIDASSDNGSVDTPVRTDPSSRRTIVAESNNGSVTVRYPDQ